MKKSIDFLTESSILLIFLILMFNEPTMAVDVSWTGRVYPLNGIDTEHTSGSITLVAEVSQIEFSGLPDDEYDDAACQIDYNWYVNDVLTSVHTDSITLAMNQNNILGRGVYHVRCEARCHLTPKNQENDNGLWTDWKLVGQHNATFFTLDFQRQDGTSVNAVKISEGGSENVNAIILPVCSPVITLIKSSSNITATYQIPGIVTIGGNELGTYTLSAQYRGRTIATLPVNVLDAYVQISIAP